MLCRLAPLALILPLLAACAPERPDLLDEVSPEARAEDFPEIVPLQPLLDQADAQEPRVAAEEGRSLEARAADLRRRAESLRRMPL